MKYTNINDINNLKIGQWYSYCCHEDLYQIKNQKNIDDIIDDWKENIMNCQVWDTKLNALIEIRNMWIKSNSLLNNTTKQIEECNDLIIKENYYI